MTCVRALPLPFVPAVEDLLFWSDPAVSGTVLFALLGVYVLLVCDMGISTVSTPVSAIMTYAHTACAPRLCGGRCLFERAV